MLKKDKKLLIGASAGVLAVGGTLAIALPLALKDNNGGNKKSYIAKTSAEYKVLNKTGFIDEAIKAAGSFANTSATGANYVFDKDTAKISFDGSIATFNLQSSSVNASTFAEGATATPALKPVTANAIITFDLSTIKDADNGLNKLKDAKVTFVNDKKEIIVIGTKDKTKNTYTYKDEKGAALSSAVEQIVTTTNTAMQDKGNVDKAIKMQKSLDKLTGEEIANAIITNGGKAKDKTNTTIFADATDQSVTIDSNNYTYTISNSKQKAAQGEVEFDIVINNTFASGAQVSTEAKTITGIKVTGLAKQQSNQEIANEVKASLEKISVSTATAVAAVTTATDFNEQILKSLGTVSGNFPSLLDGVTLKYTVEKIDTPASMTANTGNLTVTIEANNPPATGGAATATAEIVISVNNPAVQKVQDIKVALEKMSVTDIPNEVAAQSDQPFNEAVLTALQGTASGTFPTDVSTVNMTYSVKEIEKGQSGNLTVTITDKTATAITATANIPLSVKADKPVDLDTELAKINATYQSTKNVTQLEALQNKSNVTPTELGITVTSSIDSRATLSFDATTYDTTGGSLGVTAKVTDKDGNVKSRTIQITGVQFNDYKKETIDKYRDDTKTTFADAYSDANGTKIDADATFDSLTTIDAILAKANELINAGVFYAPTPGAPVTITVPDSKNDPVAAYKGILVTLFSDLYSTDGSDGKAQTLVSTDSLNGGDVNTLKTQATELMAKAYTKATITAGAPAQINVDDVKIPVKDDYSDAKLTEYKNNLKALFANTFKSADNSDGAPNLSTIKNAASIDKAKTAAKAIVAFGAKTVTPGSKATPTLAGVPDFDAYKTDSVTDYKNKLVALFKGKYSTNGANGSTQTAIDTSGITGTPEQMHTKAVELAKSVFTKNAPVAGVKATITIDPIPANDAWSKAAVDKFRDDIKGLYTDLVDKDGKPVNLAALDAANTIEDLKTEQGNIGEVHEKGADDKAGAVKPITLPKDPDKDALSDKALADYKTTQKQKFDGKFSTDGTGGSTQTPINTSKIDSSTDAAGVNTEATTLAASAFEKMTWTAGTKETTNVNPVPPKDAYTPEKVKEYVDGLINALKDLYTTSGEGQQKTNTSTIKGDPANAKAAADEILKDGVFNEVKVTPGTEVDKGSAIDGVGLPTADQWKTDTVTKYKEDLVKLFDGKFKTNGSTVGVQESVDTKAITDASSIDAAKTAAEQITPVYEARTITKGKANSKAIPEPKSDAVQSYKDTLIALFANKYDKPGSDQAIITTKTISEATDIADAKAKAEALASDGVYEKYEAGHSKSVQKIAKPPFDTVKPAYANPAIDTEATVLYL